MTNVTETALGAQGEVRIYKLDRLPPGLSRAQIEHAGGLPIISHSERGHHHVLTGDCDLLEGPDVLPGMKVFYAILKSPGGLFQDAPEPHGEYNFAPGDIIKFEMDIDFNPFSDKARRSAD